MVILEGINDLPGVGQAVVELRMQSAESLGVEAA